MPNTWSKIDKDSPGIYNKGLREMKHLLELFDIVLRTH